jgi:DNA-binding transcriptional LysR family regulator
MARPLDFRQIQAFRAVMMTGTTTAAARMLHTTQPSVSRLIAQAQAATQLKLFDLHNGRLRPTHEAHELFKTVQRHFHGLESIESRVESMRRSGSGYLSLGCTPSLGLSVIPEVVSRFMREYPEVRLNIQTLGSLQLREGLLHGNFDLGVSTSRMALHPHQETLLGSCAAVCVMNKGHALADRHVIHARDLAQATLLSLNPDDELAVAVAEMLAFHEVAPAGRIDTPFSTTICGLALHTEGVGIVNRYVARAFTDKLAVLPFEPDIHIATWLGLPDQRAPSALASRFSQMVAEVLAEDQNHALAPTR